LRDAGQVPEARLVLETIVRPEQDGEQRESRQVEQLGLDHSPELPPPRPRMTDRTPRTKMNMTDHHGHHCTSVTNATPARAATERKRGFSLFTAPMNTITIMRMTMMARRPTA